MKFSFNPEVSESERQGAEQKLTRVIIDLGLRTGNYHVGSGLGGNNYQLLRLGEHDQRVDKELCRVVFGYPWAVMVWGYDWLMRSSLTEIRAELNLIMGNNEVAQRQLTKLLGGRIPPSQLEDGFLGNALRMRTVESFKSLSWQEQLLGACALCDELVDKLDAGQPADHIITTLLDSLPPEILLLSVRWRIGIAKLVKYNLDEDSILGPALYRVNKLA